MAPPPSRALRWPLRGRTRPLDRQALGLELLGEQEGELQRLAGVEARIALRLVAFVQLVDRDLGRAADALGDLLAGHLEMDAAGMGALGAMHGEELLHLAQDVVEVASLLAVRRALG